MADAPGPADRVRQTPAYRTLTQRTKYKYRQLVRQQKTRRKDFDLDQWLITFLKAKADVALSFHAPRDWAIKEDLVSAAEAEIKQWINKGTLDI